MASQQGPNNSHNAANVPGQAQMRREWDDMVNQPSDVHNQGQNTNFLQETGTQVKNMAQGAADVGKGAAQGAVSIARGVALGAANVAQGAADAVKNTLGMNQDTTTGTTTLPSTNPNTGGSAHPSNINNSIDLEGLNYPSDTNINMGIDSTYPSNTNNPINPNIRI